MKLKRTFQIDQTEFGNIFLHNVYVTGFWKMKNFVMWTQNKPSLYTVGIT